jgi:Domain of unknown function (DUF4269)
MEQNWRDISYLSRGTPRQRSAYANIRSLKVLESLAEFDPVVASTVCIDIDIPSSDLDIICEVHDPIAFESKLREIFRNLRSFQVRRSGAGSGVVVASFFHCEWEYEVFGQPIPVERQNAYRHMQQTFRVVSLGGEVWRDAIRTLKIKGLKTEPAVALALGLEGDPYEAVLSLESLSREELAGRLARTSPKSA